MNKAGFTLIEIIIVIAIIAAMATIVSPLLFGPKAKAQRSQYIAQLNQLLFLGWQQARITGKIHTVEFNFTNKTVSLQIVEDDITKRKPVSINYQQTQIEWPEQFDIKNFIIEGDDQMAQGGGKRTSWFYIVPDGLTQDVILNFFDTKDLSPSGDPRPVGLVLNPFSAQFKEYDSFQK